MDNASGHELAARECRSTQENNPGSGRTGNLASPAPGRVGDAGQRVARLRSAIETEIIPRLIVQHRTPAAPAAGAAENDARSQADLVAEFCHLVMNRDLGAALSYVEGMRERGNPLESIYLHLLAPAARYMGELWEQDLCDFSTVTIGLCRLHQMLRELSPAFRNETEYREPGPRALLSPVPGEQHTFGLSMVAEFFSVSGWEVWMEAPSTCDSLQSMVQGTWFALVGFSASRELDLDELTQDIRGLRRASCNRAICVMVGGAAFTANPGLATMVGADATASDARHAAFQAQNLLSLLAKKE